MSLATSSAIPAHVGVILDGNRRWAKTRMLPTLEGHRRGYSNLVKIAEYAFASGVQYLSAYVFSTENWKRSKEEVDYLMDLALKVFKKDIQKFHKKGFRIRWFGIPDGLSDEHITAINESVELTKNNTGGQLCLCFNYGGTREIVESVKSIIDSGVESHEVTEEMIRSNMFCPDVPDIDLMIRTSGEQRISNFMLWRVAYSELVFVKKHFPASTKKTFKKHWMNTPQETADSAATPLRRVKRFFVL